MERTAELPEWPDGLTRVPYWVFQRPDVYAAEQENLFRGPHWNYLCLEAEVASPGQFRTSFLGDTPVIVTRDRDGELYAFENRCAHRGALLALDDKGTAKDFTCVYHAWTYNLQGDLTGVAFKDGIKGKGGMPESFCMEAHGPRKLRLAVVHGLVFGSFSDDVDDIEDYLGEEILGRIERVLGGRTPVVIGRFTQMLPNNWKLYVENVKDSYHASILHLFFTTFEINRLSQSGAIIVSENGGHHVSYSAIDREAERDAAYTEQNIRSDSGYRLADPSLLEGFSEVGDDTTLQILSTFPAFVLQQIQNSVAVRQILPRGVDRTELNWTLLGFAEDTPEQRRVRLKQANLVGSAGYISMEDGCVGGFVQRGVAGAPDQTAVLEMGGASAESSESRVTEASIRGFWKAYLAAMGIRQEAQA
ncbi:aromatic ring-hydroxylating dioxygenase subunit alpha [Pseudonocardia acidicola]|uniref:Rieske 2Fe-2S domain-containing protein n=1 Tax=Pseudonocardia acidicola TaxID=2724939 RepID=A0ABX1SMT4_9PSEU|nr:aromatic ring-hydroxylating dioxygenase subunit alpha [Pseudonocardia acidicola]NMI01717.1 Rieske 2Fe-2S domain-containing protein [Pseudonocardia acidicola]